MTDNPTDPLVTVSEAAKLAIAREVAAQDAESHGAVQAAIAFREGKADNSISVRVATAAIARFEASISHHARMREADGISATRLARRFHALYEGLAPEFGYETREQTKRFDPASVNGQLMIAVCASLLQEAALASLQPPKDEMRADLEYLLDCVDVHADKFPVPEHMRARTARIRAALTSQGGEHEPSI